MGCDISGEVEKTPRHIPVWMYGEVGGYTFLPPNDVEEQLERNGFSTERG